MLDTFISIFFCCPPFEKEGVPFRVEDLEYLIFLNPSSAKCGYLSLF